MPKRTSDEAKIRQITFGRYLQTLRRKNKLSLNDVAKEFNITIGAVGHYEQGRRRVDMEALLKFAKLYHIKARMLVRHYIGDTTKDY